MYRPFINEKVQSYLFRIYHFSKNPVSHSITFWSLCLFFYLSFYLSYNSIYSLLYITSSIFYLFIENSTDVSRIRLRKKTDILTIQIIFDIPYHSSSYSELLWNALCIEKLMVNGCSLFQKGQCEPIFYISLH